MFAHAAALKKEGEGQCYSGTSGGQSDPTWKSIQVPLWLQRKVPELPYQHPKAQPRVF